MFPALAAAAAESFETIFIILCFMILYALWNLFSLLHPSPKYKNEHCNMKNAAPKKKAAEEHFQYFFYVELISIVSGHIARRRQCWAAEGS